MENCSLSQLIIIIHVPPIRILICSLLEAMEDLGLPTDSTYFGKTQLHSQPLLYHAFDAILDTSIHSSKQGSQRQTSSPRGSELESLCLKEPLCLQCKGQKYRFTAYFHNMKIFPRPPHELVRLIEKSYILRDRLKSFLVTYTMRPIDQDRIWGIEEEINKWQQEIIFLMKNVICSAHFELDFSPLERAKNWSLLMADKVRDHIWGITRLEMPKGTLQMLLSEYRMAWERVWQGYLRDQAASQHMFVQTLDSDGNESTAGTA